MTIVKTPRKLIEVALPLDKINVTAARCRWRRNDWDWKAAHHCGGV